MKFIQEIKSGLKYEFINAHNNSITIEYKRNQFLVKESDTNKKYVVDESVLKSLTVSINNNGYELENVYEKSYSITMAVIFVLINVVFFILAKELNSNIPFYILGGINIISIFIPFTKYKKM